MVKEERIGNTRKSEQRGNSNSKTKGAMILSNLVMTN